jgi:hypothetical protein
LAFWLSNTVVLREIIAQTFGISRQSTPTMVSMNMNDSGKMIGENSMKMLWENSFNGKHTKLSAMQMPEDWQETSTFLAALEKIESWIFSRIVETLWWQVNICLTQCILFGTSMWLATFIRNPVFYK